MARARGEHESMAQPLPDKLFFKIGEVAELVGVRPHVLRYWESEFAALRPMKTRGAHRVYRRRDVELAMLVRRLLQDEGFTIAGAKRRLRELGKDRVSSEPDPEAQRDVGVRADLLELRAELRALQDRLARVIHDDEHAPSAPETTVTVTEAVQSSVPIRARRGPST